MSLEKNSLVVERLSLLGNKQEGGIVLTRLLHISHTEFNNEDVVSKENQFSNNHSKIFFLGIFNLTSKKKRDRHLSFNLLNYSTIMLLY